FAAPATFAKVFIPCFLDMDANVAVSPGETVYLAIRQDTVSGAAPNPTCGMSQAKDIRITGFGSLAPGTAVKITDPDFLKVLSQLGAVPAVPAVQLPTAAHAIRVLNQGTLESTIRKTDTVYLDVMNTGAVPPRAEVGDLRHTACGAMTAGTQVQGSDPDLNMVLSELADSGSIGVSVVPKSLYTANMVHEYGSGWYLNVDLDAAAGGVGPEEGDVRLTSSVPNPMADIPALVGNPGPVVDGLTFSKKVVAPGEMFQVNIVVKNPTTKVGSALVKTSLDGVAVDARGTPTLATNEVATLIVSLFAPTTPGQHKVTSGDYTGFFDVEGTTATPASVSTVTVTGSPAIVKQDAPGLAPIAVLGMVVVALMVLRRRTA
ncbi:MAG: hypothetical protein QOC71_2028, partial [Thermoplasmata archaeon]|nr:hypothetical protein [Thermoplasmata archaeon]